MCLQDLRFADDSSTSKLLEADELKEKNGDVTMEEIGKIANDEDEQDYEAEEKSIDEIKDLPPKEKREPKEKSKDESKPEPEVSMDNSNVDNEDSLNLTIGEEDEQLLRDEENETSDAKGELCSGRGPSICNRCIFWMFSKSLA